MQNPILIIWGSSFRMSSLWGFLFWLRCSVGPPFFFSSVLLGGRGCPYGRGCAIWAFEQNQEWRGVGKHTSYGMGSTTHCERLWSLKRRREETILSKYVTAFRDWTFSSATLKPFLKRVIQWTYEAGQGICYYLALFNLNYPFFLNE
jgi:hypothetical protein